jgi:hypothetical protein
MGVRSCLTVFQGVRATVGFERRRAVLGEDLGV